MIYSCFDPASGLYDYYADDRRLAINADLPVPAMPGLAGAIGVAAIEAGRPLPSGAKPIGRGWHAMGLVVQCGRGPVGELPSGDEAWAWVRDGGWKWIALGAAALFVLRRI